ncbi:LysR family transcriptional regulator [Arenibaculum pallidiluteum]|uniref:LysR family transcriptional regulator n=1 Tax=Arenibaculum pallidiluteum TaxID=2812559 RepID=UPI001A9736B6|nr:LysR family transcriptional regulator [Arenibaculum pallidiluteum]
MDRLAAMELFVRIVETGSFSAAAEQLGMSRALASRTIIDLEERLGTRLLNRTTRRLSPTEAGAAYCRRAQRILADVAEADEEASALHARPRGVLRVSAPMSFGPLHVAPDIGDYMRLNPEVTVELALNDRVVDLVEEGFDVAIRIGRLADSTLVARRLAVCRILACASPAYLAEHGEPRHPADLARHHCLAYAYDSFRGNWTFEGPEGAVTVQLSSRLSANSGTALMAAVCAGVGIAVQPDFIAAPDIRAGRAVEILPDWRLPELAVHAVYPPTRSLSAKVRSFVDFLAARYRTPAWTLPAPLTPPGSGLT